MSLVAAAGMAVCACVGAAVLQLWPLTSDTPADVLACHAALLTTNGDVLIVGSEQTEDYTLQVRCA